MSVASLVLPQVISARAVDLDADYGFSRTIKLWPAYDRYETETAVIPALTRRRASRPLSVRTLKYGVSEETGVGPAVLRFYYNLLNILR